MNMLLLCHGPTSEHMNKSPDKKLFENMYSSIIIIMIIINVLGDYNQSSDELKNNHLESKFIDIIFCNPDLIFQCKKRIYE